MSYSTTQYSLDASNVAMSAAFCNNDLVTYPTAPAMPTGENDAWPTVNLFTRDRYSYALLAQQSGTPLNLDLHLAAATSVKMFGLLGVLRPSTMSYPSSVTVSYSTSTSYPGSWTSMGTLTWAPASRDLVTVLDTAVTGVHFIRFSFANAASAYFGGAVGKLLIAAAPVDMGILYSPRTTHTPLHARLRVETVDRRPSVTEYGPTRRAVSLQFNALTHARMLEARTLGDELYPFLLKNGVDGTWSECLPSPDGTIAEHAWGQVESSANLTDLWNASLDVETLY